jgi:hypothetical protein
MDEAVQFWGVGVHVLASDHGRKATGISGSSFLGGCRLGCASWVVAHSEVILGQVLRNPVAVEKVGFPKKSQKSGERKCLGD